LAAMRRPSSLVNNLASSTPSPRPSLYRPLLQDARPLPDCVDCFGEQLASLVEIVAGIN